MWVAGQGGYAAVSSLSGLRTTAGEHHRNLAHFVPELIQRGSRFTAKTIRNRKSAHVPRSASAETQQLPLFNATP